MRQTDPLKRSKQSAAWAKLLTAISNSMSITAIMSAIIGGPVGLTVALAVMSAGVTTGNLTRTIKRERREGYVLPRQEPHLGKLRKQLRDRDHVLVAKYMRGNQLQEAIVREALPRRDINTQGLDIKLLSDILSAADGKAVLFFGRSM